VEGIGHGFTWGFIKYVSEVTEGKPRKTILKETRLQTKMEYDVSLNQRWNANTSKQRLFDFRQSSISTAESITQQHNCLIFMQSSISTAESITQQHNCLILCISTAESITKQHNCLILSRVVSLELSRLTSNITGISKWLLSWLKESVSGKVLSRNTGCHAWSDLVSFLSLSTQNPEHCLEMRQDTFRIYSFRYMITQSSYRSKLYYNK
jgi:hypothetical protein